MIINPYNIKFNEPQTIAKDNEKLDLNTVVKEITNQLLINSQDNIENENKEVLEEKIRKELETSYKIIGKVQENIISEILNSLFGYGLLQKYIDDPEVSDIRAVAYNKIYIKKQGKWKELKKQFNSPEEFNTYIRFCAMKNNAIINTETPICIFSDRKNALRIEAGISPANVLDSSLVIRIHKKDQNLTLEELFLKHEMMSAQEYKLLRDKILDMKSIVICGKGGSGKTTLLKSLLNVLPNQISICTIEETAEIFLKNRNVIQRECLLGREEQNKVDLEKLTRHSLVMSNDVIVLGELKRSRSKCVF